MKKYLTLAAAALLLVACSEKPGYEISGTVANADLNGKYVYLYEYGVQDAAPMDSALVQNGTFTFKGTQDAPALRKLAFAEDVVEPKRAASGENAPFTSIFVLENGKLQAILDEAASALFNGWTQALISSKDRIFPTENLRAFWQGRCPITEIEAPHYPFYLWKQWDEIWKQ